MIFSKAIRHRRNAMAGWMEALQFGAGLAHGWQQKTEEMARQNETDQLNLLKILANDEENRVVPIAKEELAPDTEGFGRFFGGGHGSLKTTEGHQAFRIGGNLLAIK